MSYNTNNRMKKFILGLVALSALIGFAQPPANYYSTATGTGAQLKTQLYNIIKGHNSKSYNSLWTLYNHSAYKDTYYENDGTLMDVYSEKPNGPDSYNYTIGQADQCGNYSGEGSCYNREHVIPQSVFNEQSPMVTDAHHILPTDGYVNGMRSNFPIGKVNSPNWTSTNGSKRGSSGIPGYTGTVFEPIDEFKGDFARIYFYFVTRYETQISNWSSYAMFANNTFPGLNPAFLDMLLEWHENDPVSQREIAINNRIYQHQGNRNPYIDEPSFVAAVWGTSASVPDFEPIYVALYPNPAKDNKVNIVTDRKVEEIKLININGQIIQKIIQPSTQNDTYTLDNIPQGFYILNMNIDNQLITKKVIVN